MMYDVFPTLLIFREHVCLEPESLPHRKAVVSLPSLFFQLQVLNLHAEQER